jgi:putative FmdB family regulatory protein
MPLYEYQCQECDKRFDRLERASTPKDGICPECGGSAHRLLSAPALQFKGSGWYVNDYGKGNGLRPSAEEAEKAKSPAGSSTESKPAEKTEKKTEKMADAKVA